MSVEPPLTRTRASWVPVMLAPAAGTAILAAGVLGLLPPLLAVGLAAGVSAAVHGGLLVRMALAIHLRYHAFGPCRGVGFIGLAVLAGGASALAGTVGEHRPGRATVGLVVTVGFYLAGLILLPGTAPSFLARLRQLLDGLGLATCFLFTAWVLVIAPHGNAARLPVAIGVATSTMLAIAVIIGLRAVRYRAAARACASGTVLSVLGLATLAVVLTGTIPPTWLYLAGTALVYGPVVSLQTGRRYALTAPDQDEDGADPEGTFAGYPVLAVPIAMVLAAAVYHLITEQSFDKFSGALGCGVVAAITAREAFGVYDVRRYTRRVAFQESHFRSLVAGSSDVTVVLDADLVVRWQSPAAARQLGLSDQDVLGRPFLSLVHPDDAPTVRERLTAVLGGPTGEPDRAALVEARVRDGFGHWRDTESTVSDQRAVPEVGALVVHLRDIGERRDLERTLQRMAFTDQLTGLANRRQLMRTVGGMRAVPGQPGALLVIDLDGFTAVNDVRGHEIGDAVLIEVARRLRDGVDDSDLPARLSGDEFAVVTAGGPVQSYALASRLLTMLSQPYGLPGATVHVTACVGLAEFAGAKSVGDALSRAALALRRARQGSRSRIEWYDEALETALVRRMTLEQELPGVVARGELDLVYQPIIDLVEGHPVGAEALLRWRHPSLGSVPAADFIPVAEDLGMIDEIGEWVLHHGCRQLSGWLRDGRDLWLSVNLAPRQLAAPGLVGMVSTALDSHQIPPERLLLEVTEQGLGVDTQQAVGQLAGLRSLGVRTALTRFGTGSTPLAYLRRLPVDLLKLDRSLFAEPVGRGSPATPIIDVVIGLGRRLGLEIVAEGLEAESHLEVVRAAGCRYGQGYLFGRPVPAEHFEAFLETHRAPT